MNPDETRPENLAETADGAVDGTAATRPVPPSAVTPPRIRAAGILWGGIFAAAAVGILWIVGWPEHRSAFDRWAGSVGWAGFWIGTVVAVGAFVLLMAALSAIKRGQLRRNAGSDTRV